MSDNRSTSSKCDEIISDLEGIVAEARVLSPKAVIVIMQCSVGAMDAILVQALPGLCPADINYLLGQAIQANERSAAQYWDPPQG